MWINFYESILSSQFLYVVCAKIDAVDFFLDNDDDDVEGYFCTVCDIKIPDVYKHIQQFHNGQEVILQVPVLFLM